MAKLHAEAERNGDVDMVDATAPGASGTELDGQSMLTRLAAAPLRQYEPSYGVLFQGRPLPQETTALLQALQSELDAAHEWLQSSVSERTANLLRAAMQRHSKATSAASDASLEKRSKAGDDILPSTPSTSDLKIKTEVTTSNAAALPSTTAATAAERLAIISHAPTLEKSSPATNDDEGLPWVVSVPKIIDEEVEQEYNSLMEASSVLRHRSRAPPTTELHSAFPLLLPVQPPAAVFEAYGKVSSAQDASKNSDEVVNEVASASRLAFGATAEASVSAQAHLQVCLSHYDFSTLKKASSSFRDLLMRCLFPMCHREKRVGFPKEWRQWATRLSHRSTPVGGRSFLPCPLNFAPSTLTTSNS